MWRMESNQLATVCSSSFQEFSPHSYLSCRVIRLRLWSQKAESQEAQQEESGQEDGDAVVECGTRHVGLVCTNDP